MRYVAVLILGIALGWLAAKATASRTEIMAKASPNSVQSQGPAPTASPAQTANQSTASNVKASSPVAQKPTGNLRELRERFQEAMNADQGAEAIGAFEEMEKIAPNSVEFWESKSRYYTFMRKPEALEVLNGCLELHPRSKSCLVDRASVVLKDGTKEESEQSVQACLKAFPKDLQCRNVLAILRMNQNRFRDAVTIYEQIARDNGNNGFRFSQPMLDSQMGFALEGAGRLREAIDYFERSCQSGQDRSACEKFQELKTKL